MHRLITASILASACALAPAFTLDTSRSSEYYLHWSNGRGTYGNETYQYLDSSSSQMSGVYSFLEAQGYIVHRLGNIEGVVQLWHTGVLYYGSYYNSPDVGLSWNMYVKGEAFQNLSYAIIDYHVMNSGHKWWLNMTDVGGHTTANQFCNDWDHNQVVGNYCWNTGPGVDQVNDRYFVFGYYEEGADGSKNLYVADGVKLSLVAHTAAVPEPASIFLSSAGLLWLARRRKQPR